MLGKVLLLHCLLQILLCHQITQVYSTNIQLKIFLNQPHFIEIPFSKCFKAQYNQSLFTFTPTTLFLQQITQFPLRSSVLIDTFIDLRTAAYHKHRNILLFKNTVLLYEDTVQWVKQQNDVFTLLNSYSINDIPPNSNVKLYKMGQKGIVVPENTQSIYVVEPNQYLSYRFNRTVQITHIEAIEQNIIFCSQIDKGITKYKLVAGKIQELTHYNYSANTVLYPKIFTLTYLPLIYVLDSEIGLIEMSENTGKVLLSQKYCDTIKFVTRIHFVMVCQGHSHSVLIEAYKDDNSAAFLTLPPLYYPTYLNNLYVSERFYIGYSQKSMEVIWNTRKNRIPEMTDTKSSVLLHGLQTLTLQDAMLYTVQNGILYKYQMREKAANMSVISAVPLVKIFKVEMYGNCEEISNNSKLQKEPKTCKIIKNILLTVIEMEGARKEDFGISATIIVILIIMFLLIIWICLKKYKGLEKEARKVLENYRKKKRKKQFLV